MTVPLFNGSSILCREHDTYEQAYILAQTTEPGTVTLTLVFECGKEMYYIMTENEFVKRSHQLTDVEVATLIVRTWEEQHA